jgi:hypothetical protein
MIKTTSTTADQSPAMFTTTDMPFGRRWIVYRDLDLILIAANLDADEHRQAVEEFRRSR